MKAIAVKRLGATNKRPDRLKAFDADGFSLTWSLHCEHFDGCNDDEARGYVLAKHFAFDRWGHKSGLVAGYIKAGNFQGYVYVLV